jgi:hypothetical protein
VGVCEGGAAGVGAAIERRSEGKGDAEAKETTPRTVGLVGETRSAFLQKGGTDILSVPEGVISMRCYSTSENGQCSTRQCKSSGLFHQLN